MCVGEIENMKKFTLWLTVRYFVLVSSLIWSRGISNPFAIKTWCVNARTGPWRLQHSGNSTHNKSDHRSIVENCLILKQQRSWLYSFAILKLVCEIGCSITTHSSSTQLHCVILTRRRIDIGMPDFTRTTMHRWVPRIERFLDCPFKFFRTSLHGHQQRKGHTNLNCWDPQSAVDWNGFLWEATPAVRVEVGGPKASRRLDIFCEFPNYLSSSPWTLF